MNVFYYPCSGDGDTQCFESLRVQIHLLWSWFTYIIWHFTCILSLLSSVSSSKQKVHVVASHSFLLLVFCIAVILQS